MGIISADFFTAPLEQECKDRQISFIKKNKRINLLEINF